MKRKRRTLICLKAARKILIIYDLSGKKFYFRYHSTRYYSTRKMWKVLIDSVEKFLYLLPKKEFIINVRTP